jgi:hypothetical protein
LKEMLLSKGILTKYLDQTPRCEVKANQSWKKNILKEFLIVEMIWRLLKWHGVNKQILNSHMKLNHTSYELSFNNIHIDM